MTGRRYSFVSPHVSDVAARVILAGAFLGLAYRVVPDVLATPRLSGLLFLVNESLVVAFTLARRFPSHVDRSLVARTAAGLGTLGPLLAAPDPRVVLGGEALAMPLSMLGVAVALVGKLSLGRSLGMLPAHRGIVSSGLYRMVRHPLYLSYMLVHTSFLMTNASEWNAAVFSLTAVMLVIRMDCEERILQTDDAYRRYMGLVRYRLVPGLY